MVRPNQEAIDTFISITGAPEAVAISMLESNELALKNEQERRNLMVDWTLERGKAKSCKCFEYRVVFFSWLQKNVCDVWPAIMDKEHAGDLNTAVNAYFSEGDRKDGIGGGGGMLMSALRSQILGVRNYCRIVSLTFYFDFSMTYIGAGMICSHLVNLSLLLGAVLSWGVMWPLIGGLKGEWFPATLPALQLYQKAASRMVTRRRALQFSEDTIFDC
ncbi:Metal-nicotianamine transporter YSL3-like protein [Gossypium australe]|uniref:Metal-nicotianamine transporter YSL3-like protein n=1 Tax=Gossypium australe TaxID=47621 RepID=A0A5B6U8I2_9ROSI|nr:Metal-nicotianamine transporter YSL3-like protein [Gossypium australe]